MEFAETARFSMPGKNREAPRHSKMHEQSLALGQGSDDVFTAAADGLDRPALEPRREALREREAQIQAVEFHSGDAAPQHGARQAAADNFDFRQFRHSRLLDSLVNNDARAAGKPIASLACILY